MPGNRNWESITEQTQARPEAAIEWSTICKELSKLIEFDSMEPLRLSKRNCRWKSDRGEGERRKSRTIIITEANC